MGDEELPDRLRAAVDCASDDEPIEVVVEVSGAAPSEAALSSSSRAERIAVYKDVFAAGAEPAEQAVRRVGGEVLDRAWINQTLRARVPAGRVKELCRADSVANVDVPIVLEPDTG